MFYDNFFKSTNLSELVSPFNILTFGFQTVTIEGKCSFRSFSDEKIVLSIKKQNVFILGKNLSIENMDKNHITIVGEIETISKKEIFVNSNEQHFDN